MPHVVSERSEDCLSTALPTAPRGAGLRRGRSICYATTITVTLPFALAQFASRSLKVELGVERMALTHTQLKKGGQAV